MSTKPLEQKETLSWSFPKEFWMANLMELCERAAYYGFYIVIAIYLTRIVGFNDFWAGVITGTFAALLYLLPPFSGAIADRIGFKNGLILAFGLLSIGYFFLGVFTNKILVICFLFLIMIGGSFIKPLITGTVAKTTNQINRARGFSLFYWIVNIGSFSGKTFVPYIRQGVGLEYVNFFSAGMSILALLVGLFLFKEIDTHDEKKSFLDIFNSLWKILTNARLLMLTLIVSGFWLIQGQMYMTMPKYVIRIVGEEAKPEWLANVNPLVVVIFVVGVTQFMKRYKAVTSMLVGMLLMPFSALAMAGGPWLQEIYGAQIPIFNAVFHPLTIMMIIGISIQGLAECFISPRFLEYFSLMAPKGEEGVYLGFSHLHSFLSYLFGGVLSGWLLSKYCPAPDTLAGLSAADQAARYSHAHYIWYYFVAIGFLSAIALVIFRFVTFKMDHRNGVTDVS